jgi:hypothetical protein
MKLARRCNNSSNLFESPCEIRVANCARGQLATTFCGADRNRRLRLHAGIYGVISTYRQLFSTTRANGPLCVFPRCPPARGTLSVIAFERSDEHAQVGAISVCQSPEPDHLCKAGRPYGSPARSTERVACDAILRAGWHLLERRLRKTTEAYRNEILVSVRSPRLGVRRTSRRWWRSCSATTAPTSTARAILVGGGAKFT